jgi:hypothetical protein
MSTPAKKPAPTVTLTTGYEVELADFSGLTHLFQAIVGESSQRLKHTPGANWRTVYDACLLELHYVAGQLHAHGSSLTLPLLLDEFGAWWDDFGRLLATRPDPEHGSPGQSRKPPES